MWHIQRFQCLRQNTEWQLFREKKLRILVLLFLVSYTKSLKGLFILLLINFYSTDCIVPCNDGYSEQA